MLIKPEILKKELLKEVVKEKVKGGLSYGIEPSGYTLRLGYDFKFPIDGEVLDPMEKEETAKKFIEFGIYRPFLLKGNSFILSKSIEKFDLPNDVTAIALTKSSYARVGVFCNITTIDAGFKGDLVIEIANIGKNLVRLHPGYGIAEVLFFEHDETEGYDGNYMYQEGVKI
jgi:dCTP deaminase